MKNGINVDSKNNGFQFLKDSRYALLAILSAVVLIFSPVKNNVFSQYLAFHTVIEMFSVALSFMIFAFHFGLRTKKCTTHVTILASTFLAVALFDLFHALSFKGMPDFVSANGVNKSIDFWLCARIAQSIGFFFLATTRSKKVTSAQFIMNGLLSLGAVSFFSWAIFYHIERLPVMLIDGDGLTKAKVYSEYALLGLNALTAFFFYRHHRLETSPIQSRYLSNASLLMVATGICFSQFTIHNDMLNFWGHILKAGCYVYLYRAVLVSEILIPYDEIDVIKKKLDLDIENIKALELELERSRKIASLGSEVGRIAHDLNNVLMIVNSAAQSILKTDNNSENEIIVKKIDQIKSAVEKSRGFLKCLVNFSKNVQVEKEIVHLGSAFKDYQNLLGPLVSKNIKLNFSSEAHMPLYMIPSDLEQLILNLVINARDAIEKNDGVIRISAEQKRLNHPVDFLNYEIPVGDYLCISVEDNGSGIKKEVLTKIFDPFFTTKEVGRGTGIGLSTVVSLMQKNHGYIQVETTLGVGSKFTLYFSKDQVMQKEKLDEKMSMLESA